MYQTSLVHIIKFNKYLLQLIFQSNINTVQTKTISLTATTNNRNEVNMHLNHITQDTLKVVKQPVLCCNFCEIKVTKLRDKTEI